MFRNIITYYNNCKFETLDDVVFFPSVHILLAIMTSLKLHNVLYTD
jgi:hypothetical protein